MPLPSGAVVGIYLSWPQFALTSMVPIAFAVTVPAEALTSRLSLQTFIVSILVAGGLLIASRWFWTVAVRHYSGASA